MYKYKDTYHKHSSLIFALTNIRNVMQSELFQPSWPLFNIMNSTPDQAGLYGLDMDMESIHVDHDHEFSPSITISEESSMFSPDAYFESMLSNEFVELPVLDDDMQIILPIENIASEAIEDMCRWLEESDEMENLSPQLSMEGGDVRNPDLSTKSSEAPMVLPLVSPSLRLPGNDMETDSQLSLLHLLKAQADAMEMGQRELAEVITGCINQKVSPIGETLERLAYHLFQNQDDYLKQESDKNFEAAFKAFYEIFPYGRFAHFGANSAILEAMQDDVEMLYIVDFDMGEGVQWPSVIEAIARRRKALTLISIKAEEHDTAFAPSRWEFEETRRRLCDYARSFSLMLKVEEMDLRDMAGEINNLKKRGGETGRNYFAFNCMVGLPHMARRRSRSSVLEFLSVTKELLPNVSMNEGIIILGDGEEGERTKNCAGYSSYFDEYLTHYQALCESMEWNLPMHLTEARIAMENIFVAPFVSSLALLQKWEEIGDCSGSQGVSQLQELRLSKEILMESKEMVKEGQNSYSVRIEGQNGNEMVLQWRETPLVRICTWM